MIENIIVKNSKWNEEDFKLFFAPDEPIDLKQIHFTKQDTIEGLAYEIGAYKSKGEARRAGRFGKIKVGWSNFWINKKHKVWIWNPDKLIEDYEN